MSDVTEGKTTTFQEMYDYFLSHITDDCFIEMTKTDVIQVLEELLIAAMPHFEFPHWDCKDVLDTDNKRFRVKLSRDEMAIINLYMDMEWVSMQLANVDVIRQKYSSADFSLTSQASHMKQLVALKEDFRTEGYKMQRRYSRKEYDAASGRARSSFHRIMEPITVNSSKREDR